MTSKRSTKGDFHDSIETLFQKVKAALLPETLEYLEKVSGALKANIGPAKNFSTMNEVVGKLREAGGDRKKVEMDYMAVSTGQLIKRKVDPYSVWLMGGAFYLVAFCNVRNAVRTFAVDRIKSFRLLEDHGLWMGRS